MCEALIAVYEARRDPAILQRAVNVARRLTVELCAPSTGSNGWVIEHYTSDWVPDPLKNKDADPLSEEYIFRPPGFQPGHAAEWAKLLLLLERHCKEAAAASMMRNLGRVEAGVVPEYEWMLPRARELFGLVVGQGWDEKLGGLAYLVDETGTIRDGNKYYWALAEGIAAAGLLFVRCSSDTNGSVKESAVFYREWYNKMWEYAEAHFIDTARGGWYPMLDPNNVRTDLHAGEGHTGLPVKCYPSKTDYHPLAACYEVLRAIEAQLKVEPEANI